MTDVLKWAIPVETKPMDQSSLKRPLSPNDTRRYSFKSQRSVSDIIGPEMAQVHLTNGDEAGGSPSAPHALPAEEPAHLSPHHLAEAAALMDDDAVCSGHRVKDLIHIFEPAREDKSTSNSTSGMAEIEERTSPTSATEEESFLPCVISSAARKVKDTVKTIGHTVVEGVKSGVREVSRDIKLVAEKFFLPKSSLEEHPHNNIHVPHPNKLIGGMIGLGMHIQKTEQGHVVHNVVPDGLAAKSKLEEKDVIVRVNGNDIKDWAFEELQQFFGSLHEVEIKIVVQREKEDENGLPFCERATVTIQLSLEDEKVVVDVILEVGISGWKFTNRSGPYYISQNRIHRNTQFLMLKDNSFRMGNVHESDFSRCGFMCAHYTPVHNGPTAIINTHNHSPLDHMKPSKIGIDTDLYDKEHIQILSDNRIFYAMRQTDSNKFTFELTSRKGYFLTVNDTGELKSTKFPNRDAVDLNGQFDMVLTSRFDKKHPSDIQKYDNGKNQGLLCKDGQVGK